MSKKEAKKVVAEVRTKTLEYLKTEGRQKRLSSSCKDSRQGNQRYLGSMVHRRQSKAKFWQSPKRSKIAGSINLRDISVKPAQGSGTDKF